MSDSQTPDVPLLRKYVEWVEEQEALPNIDRDWYQKYWRSGSESRMLDLLRTEYWSGEVSTVNLGQVAMHCGTAYCLAGKVALDADPRYAQSEFVDGVHLSEKALEVLGLEGNGLGCKHPIFHGSNTAADIRRIAEELTGERL